MTIDSSQMGSTYSVAMQKPAKPTEPKAPEGGNIEGRQPPQEPKEPRKDEGMKALGVGGMLDMQG